MSDLAILLREAHNKPNFAAKVKALSAIAKLYNLTIGDVAEMYQDYINSDTFKAGA